METAASASVTRATSVQMAIRPRNVLPGKRLEPALACAIARRLNNWWGVAHCGVPCTLFVQGG